jgi:AcrR family transcriptional regulator
LGKGTETKTRILDAALDIMSVYGVGGASMRGIAKAANINAASIYNYFGSKEEIVQSLYDYYREQYRKARPDIEELLTRAETEPPLDVLMACDFHYTVEVERKMDKIFLIAAYRVSSDQVSAQFVHDIIFASPQETVRPLLGRMIELGKIEPMDIDAFVNLLIYLTFGAAVLNSTPLRIELADWLDSFGLLFSMIHPTRG